MFDTDFSRLKEFLSQENGMKVDLTFENVLRVSIKTHIEHHRRSKTVTEFKHNDCLFSMWFDSASVKKIRLIGPVDDLSVLDILKGNITADFPDVNYLGLDETLQSSVSKTLGYVSLMFSGNPGTVLKQLKSREDIKEALSLPDIDRKFLAIASAITVEDSFYKNDDPQDCLFHEKTMLTKKDGLYGLDYFITVMAEGEILSTEKVQEIFNRSIRKFPLTTQCTIHGW